jgi:hypothetical protein
VLSEDVTLSADEVDGDAVVEGHSVERAERDRRIASQHLCQKRRGRLRVTGLNDRVVELDGQALLSGMMNQRVPFR